MNERTNESPPVFYRTSSPSGPLPKKWENQRFKSFFVYVSVLEGGLGGILGEDGAWLPLPTRMQRYCDPASILMMNDFYFQDGE